MLRHWGNLALSVLIALGAGLLTEWFLRWILRRSRHALEDRGAEGIGRGLLFVVTLTLLDLVCVTAFAVVSYCILAFLEPTYTARLVALTLINAYILTGVVLALARMILVPGVPSLRMVPLEDATAASIYVWLRRIASLGVYGYFGIEAARLLGLPLILGKAFRKLLGLVITVILVRFVLKKRKEVTAALRGERSAAAPKEEASTPRGAGPSRALVGVMGRLAGIWHLVAVALIVALYGTWAFEVQGGFKFLGQAVMVTIAALLAAVLLNRGLQWGIKRLFQLSTEMTRSYTGFEARASHYLPPLQKGMKVAVYGLAAFVVLEAWGFGTWTWLTSEEGTFVLSELGTVLLIIAVAFAFLEVVSALIERTLEHEAVQGRGASQRKLTLLPLLKNTVRIVIGLISVMIVLSELGVDIGPLLAGAGVFGLAIGFGAQTLVRDVITGGFILMEDAISVGDWVDAGGYSGEVESLSIRTVKLRDLNGTVHVVPFGDVTSVSNYNRGYGYAMIDAQVGYQANYDQVVQELRAVANAMRADPEWNPYLWGELETLGVNEIGESSLAIQARLRTRPLKQFSVKREFLRRMKERFDAAGIEIPYPHRTILFEADREDPDQPVWSAQALHSVRSEGPTSPSPAGFPSGHSADGMESNTGGKAP